MKEAPHENELRNDPNERGYGLIDRIGYVASKIATDTAQQIPYVGPPVARQVDRLCANFDWARDFILRRSTEARGAGCDAVRDSVNEYQLGQLKSPNAPTVKTEGSLEAPRR